MRNRITALLKRPYYLEPGLAQRWLNSFFYAAFVLIFLFIFRPFDLNLMHAGLFVICLGYGGVTFVVMALLNLLTQPVFPGYFNEEKWNLGKELLWNLINILLIGLGNALYSAWIGVSALSFNTIMIFELYTVTVAALPIIISVLYKESKRKRQFEHDSTAINKQLKEHPSHEDGDSRITIGSENKNEDLEVSVKDLLYIRSADNYIEVFYIRDNTIARKLLRNSLKAVVTSLSVRKELYRCHKSYFVNLQKVRSVSGNAQGLKLHLEQGEQTVPVARNQIQEIRRLLEKKIER
jgi:DNA-binding LytR/AlgR family response regulator